VDIAIGRRLFLSLAMDVYPADPSTGSGTTLRKRLFNVGSTIPFDRLRDRYSNIGVTPLRQAQGSFSEGSTIESV